MDNQEARETLGAQDTGRRQIYKTQKKPKKKPTHTLKT